MYCCQKSSLGVKHFICFTVKSQFLLGNKVNQGKVDKFRASSPCRQQIYSQQSSNVVHGVLQPWPYPGNPEVKEYFLPIFKGVYFQAPSFGKSLIWQAKNSHCSAKSRKWSKLPPYFRLETFYQVVLLTILLFCSISIWVLPTKRNWLHRKDAWQIHGNVSIYPNTSLISQQLGSFP